MDGIPTLEFDEECLVVLSSRKNPVGKQQCEIQFKSVKRCNFKYFVKCVTYDHRAEIAPVGWTAGSLVGRRTKGPRHRWRGAGA
jgi:hypothetical protein